MKSSFLSCAAVLTVAGMATAATPQAASPVKTGTQTSTNLKMKLGQQVPEMGQFVARPTSELPQFVHEPIEFAMAKVDPQGNLVEITPWMPYDPRGEFGSRATQEACFDSLELDACTPLTFGAVIGTTTVLSVTAFNYRGGSACFTGTGVDGVRYTIFSSSQRLVNWAMDFNFRPGTLANGTNAIQRFPMLYQGVQGTTLFFAVGFFNDWIENATARLASSGGFNVFLFNAGTLPGTNVGQLATYIGTFSFGTGSLQRPILQVNPAPTTPAIRCSVAVEMWSSFNGTLSGNPYYGNGGGPAFWGTGQLQTPSLRNVGFGEIGGDELYIDTEPPSAASGGILGPNTVANGPVQVTPVQACFANGLVPAVTAIVDIVPDVSIPAITAPTITAPSNGATNVNFPIAFTWSGNAGDQLLVHQVADNNTFTTNNRSFAGTAIIGVTYNDFTPQLAPGGTYFSRVLATGPSRFSTQGPGCVHPVPPVNAASGTISFTLSNNPGQFQLSTPAAGTTGVSAAGGTSFTWTSSATAASYTIEIANDPGFVAGSIVQSSNTGLTQSYVLAAVPEGTYWWRVRATNGSGSTLAWNGPRTFTTSAAPAPGAFAMAAPASGSATGQNVLFELVQGTGGAQPSFGAIDYRLDVSQDSTFATGVSTFTGITPAGITITGFPAGQWNWRWYARNNQSFNPGVLATGGSSNPVPGAFFASVIATGPFQWALLTPAYNSTGVGLNPTFTWAFPATNTTIAPYTLDIATDVNFTTIVGSINIPTAATTATYSGTPLAPNTLHYWRLTDAAGATATNSAYQFTTGTGVPAPGAFTLTTPANSATGVAVLASFAWTASSNATSYTLQVTNPADTGFTSPVVNQAGIAGTTFTLSSPLANGTSYIWRVRAVNGTGTTTAGNAPFSFTTVPATVPPSAFNLTSPTANQLIALLPVPTSRTPTITWTSSTGTPTPTYNVDVSTNAGFTGIVASATGLTGNSWTVTPALNYATKYWARVRATNTAGTTNSTPASVNFGIKCQADVDNNGAVAANDLSLLLGAFGGGLGGPADLDGVGGVAGNDLSILLSSFGNCSITLP
ncbi:MAG: hypothetical protein IBJ11_00110 [Phycisphaerales bacterium]|nr:hypothetical protein [Phycisphaerales bacterium]